MLKEGMYVADRYEIIGKVGAGGMSDVFKAKDLTLGRFVAIKVLKADFAEDLNFVTKFRTEAQSAAGLEHPNIVNIYDVGSENGMHYIVMEYVEGVTLKTYIEKKGQLSFKEAVSIAIQVGRGIEAAHNKGIIHRDIKPQNIIISTEGKVKVTDFGIARAATSNTINSDVMGSVHYSSPEQARNGFVDGKSDIYSLGIVMYEMVTGRVPFDGDTTVAVAIQHLQEEMVSPSAYAVDLPISMEKIILKCTQKNPDRRYESITALLADLRKALISPDEDFVVMVPLTNQDKTRVIKQEDLKQIKKEAGNIHVKSSDIQPKKEEVYYKEEDEEGEDEFEDEGELNPKMEKAITVMGIAAAVVIVALIAVLLVNLFGGFSGKNKKNSETQSSQTTQTETTQTETTATEAENDGEGISVPDLYGKTFSEAKDMLNQLGLGIYQEGEVSSDIYAEGEIVNQTPEAGTTAKEHDTINVIISSGKGSVDIPNVTGKKEADAVKELNDAGFKPNKTYDYSDTVEEGYVISQTPAGESQGKEGDTITLVISQGTKLVSVPSITEPNFTAEADAKKKLTALGLVVKVEEAYSDRFSVGIVMEQSIAAGTLVEPGTTITIKVSQGPEPVQEVPATTYSFKATITLPTDITNVSGANITLYDTAGNSLAQWSKAITDDFSISKSGLMASEGYLVITWLDLDGNKINDQKTSTYSFTPES